MRINQISVKKLFGVFDHTIPLNVSDRITIIHGSNGCGKTILLKIIHGLFNSRYSEIRSIPFAEFRVDFDDGRYLTVTKAIEPDNENYKSPIIKLIDEYNDSNSLNSERVIAKIQLAEKEIKNFTKILLDNIIPGLERINQSEWFYRPTNETLSLEDIIDRFREILPDNLIQISEENSKELSNIKQIVKVNAITDQRLFHYKIQKIKKNNLNLDINTQLIIPFSAVISYAEDIANKIQKKLTEYANYSQSLDSIFPLKVIESMQEKNNYNLSKKDIKQRINQILIKIKKLIELGLLENTKKQNIFESEEIPENIDDQTHMILLLYFEDIDKKLNTFQGLANKIELFKKIIQDRFKYKQMTINPTEGFSFTTAEGHPLSLTDLSSGEQHQLVLLYELLFKVEPNSLILIDEPELSLHLAWQIKFLEDLQEITQLGNFDVLIATHSPDIISDRWDLTVELKGPVA